MCVYVCINGAMPNQCILLHVVRTAHNSVSQYFLFVNLVRTMWCVFIARLFNSQTCNRKIVSNQWNATKRPYNSELQARCYILVFGSSSDVVYCSTTFTNIVYFCITYIDLLDRVWIEYIIPMQLQACVADKIQCPRHRHKNQHSFKMWKCVLLSFGSRNVPR